MSSVVGFLEAIGACADRRHATRQDLYNVLAQSTIAPDVRWAILRGDAARLGVVLGTRRQLVCGIFVPDLEPEAAQRAAAA